ncbi:DUF1839 family protein [Sphingomonas panacisoli]|uniref:DUF1839 family protein n=1 Tax=Sphingomonas panacisoli TaxID=1813879 RepID=UPI0016469A21|nr:DUF1839 family protein [Sphingomonas panacisoli]
MAVTRVVALHGLDAGAHDAHRLHAPDRIWPETNCYADLWIELLHAQGMDPHAMLPCVFGLDFEGDQWTFFKPSLADLRTLYGIDVQELTLWRPLLDHALEHVGAGKLVSVEVDSWWLPDTAGTDYREEHGKTTIVINDVDIAARRLRYFHNAGYFTLDGEDFARTFWLDGEAPILPTYAELIRIDRAVVRDTATLRALSRGLLGEQLNWRPADNPVERFRSRFDADLPALQEAGLAQYHKWAFAGLRQLGAASALAAEFLRWQWADEAPENAIQAFERIATLAKTLTLKSARAVNSGRPLDATESFDEMAEAWQIAMDGTIAALARSGADEA